MLAHFTVPNPQSEIQYTIDGAEHQYDYVSQCADRLVSSRCCIQACVSEVVQPMYRVEPTSDLPTSSGVLFVMPVASCNTPPCSTPLTTFTIRQVQFTSHMHAVVRLICTTLSELQVAIPYHPPPNQIQSGVLCSTSNETMAAVRCHIHVALRFRNQCFLQVTRNTLLQVTTDRCAWGWAWGGTTDPSAADKVLPKRLLGCLPAAAPLTANCLGGWGQGAGGAAADRPWALLVLALLRLLGGSSSSSKSRC